jgi:hypothetical protein
MFISDIIVLNDIFKVLFNRLDVSFYRKSQFIGQIFSKFSSLIPSSSCTFNGFGLRSIFFQDATCRFHHESWKGKGNKSNIEVT